MRSWKQHIVSKEQQSGQKHYLDRRRFNRWNIMSGGEALTPAQCKQLETSVRDSGGIIVERMTAGSRGCVFKLRADDGTFYIKKFMDAEDYGAFNTVRDMFRERNLLFDDFHPPILAEGQAIHDGLYFVDMAVGDKVDILDDDAIADMLGTMHQHNIFHGDIFRLEGEASTYQSPMYILNHANVVKMDDGSVRFIDFGNQYNHENPLVFEREQLQLFLNGTNNVRYLRRKVSTQKKRKRLEQGNTSFGRGTRLNFNLVGDDAHDSPRMQDRHEGLIFRGVRDEGVRLIWMKIFGRDPGRKKNVRHQTKDTTHNFLHGPTRHQL